jgi:hypothetical protein
VTWPLVSSDRRTQRLMGCWPVFDVAMFARNLLGEMGVMT